MPGLVVKLFGTFSAERDGSSLVFPTAKVRAILSFLALESGRPTPREKLAGLFWPDMPQDAAFENLRQALSRLRKALGEREGRPAILVAGRDQVQLNPQAVVQVDVERFEEALAFVSRHTHRHPESCPACAHHIQVACALFQGDFLEDISLPDSDLFEEWAAGRRAHYHAQAVDAFSWLAQYHLRQGKFVEAELSAYHAAELEPLSEPACLNLLEILAQAGKTGQAVAYYRSFTARYEAELLQSPSNRLAEFAEQVRLGEAGACGGPMRGMPAPLLPLVGRQVELDELRAWMSDPARRLITLQGPGGVGKTRLAIEAACRQSRIFADGVVYADLSNARGPGDCMEAVAVAAGIPLIAQGKLETQVREFFQDRDMLLALDGLESPGCCDELVLSLLQAAPGLVILVVSRERLGLEGEWVFPLGGLPYPPESQVDIEKYAAVELFVLHARRVDPRFDMTPESAEAVSQVCRLVGGIPLAIGLAAAWVRVLSCREIAGELQGSMDLLIGVQGQANQRSMGLRAVLDQSWQRLPPDEQRVFRLLSVFRGGFDRQAAAVVAGAGLAELAGLIDRSFLLVSPEGRYDLHDLLRRYGEEQLQAAGESEAAFRRHFDFFLEQAIRNEASLHSGPSIQAAFWLVKEQANLRAAYEWALSRHPEGAARLAKGMHADMHKSGVHRLSSR